jgi:type VI secretion system secreted protein VgrG
MARQIELTTPLGKDVLLFRAMHVREELGRLSEIDLSALSTKGDIGLSDILSKNVTVKLELRSGGFRYFNGYVTRFSQGGMVGRYYQYRMIVRSWLWFATRTADCRIFQEKTVPEIIKEVFADHPVAVFEDGLTGKYAKRTYCVQYRETDFNFISRLMEEEGIYYYFDHQDGRHVLKLVDSDSGHKALEHKATIAYFPPGKEIRADEEYIHACTFDQNVKPGNVAQTDFDFTKPKADLTTKAKLIEKHERADYEIFDYPGEYVQTDEGDRYARARVDELHSDFDRGELECNVREISVGRTFTFTNAPRRDQEREYLIVGAQYQLQDNAYESSSAEGASYHCQFTVQQRRQQFRPARLTPEPKVSGPQTAMVVGPAGEEIWTDKYGRVKVQFHWDRYGKKDENSSCWIRVSHPWAGKSWGAVSIPRIGQEVIVDFLEGDPDQPIITGRVYNADTMPPYVLPAGAVVSGIKSNSTKGGGGYNEMSMNDTKGKEHITIHAQYDMSTTVEHDDSQTVHNNRTISVDGTHTETIKKDTTVLVTQGKETNTVNKEILITSQTAHVYVTAATEIKLQVGASKLHMFADGRIELSGVNIAIDGSAKVRTHGAEVTSEADSQHQTKGAIVISEGSATNTVKGGMVMLNP